MTIELEDSRREHLISIEETKRRARFELEDERSQHKKEQEEQRRHAEKQLEQIVRSHQLELEDERCQHKKELEGGRRDAEEELERVMRSHQLETVETDRKLAYQLEVARSTHAEEVSGLKAQVANLELNTQGQSQAFTDLERRLEETGASLNRALEELRAEKALHEELGQQVYTRSEEARKMEAQLAILTADKQTQAKAFVDLTQRMEDAVTTADRSLDKLRAEESLRRKLHNQVQELKGNIRVFCRVRPVLEVEVDEAAKIEFPDGSGDSKEVVILSEQKSAVGNVTTSRNGFSFDRVFGARSRNAEVFDEISQLVQSALDGYNVCIFCYGQTGSGKTYTMSSPDGMIPLAVHQIYETATKLREKGWEYTMDGSFTEVYNEMLNDLLGKAEELDKRKHEIRHDGKGKTTVTDMTSVRLDSASTVKSLLRRAEANRSVAATNANERSSRGHSVFTLKLAGENGITGEKSEGTLNLVDLAGSERLSHSGATGDRLRETQNINRSLSCLGDVISALGQGKQGTHVPYRNSKVS